MSHVYYNEIDPFAAAWLRELIREGLIADGTVDERDIRDVAPDELAGFAQCHFFAGIGVWSYALRSAGWPDDRQVWTGSCPCQPFSAAGKRGGTDDERHLWPSWFHLIEQRRPAVVFGEQVASADGLGWLDLVQADLEGADYAAGAVDLCAAGVGAPHIRQRLWFVAEQGENRCDQSSAGSWAIGGETTRRRSLTQQPITRNATGAEPIGRGSERLADANGERCVGLDALLRRNEAGRFAGDIRQTAGGGKEGFVGHPESGRRREFWDAPQPGRGGHADGASGASGGLADAHGGDASAEWEQRGGEHGQRSEDGLSVRPGDSGLGHNCGPKLERPGPTNGLWRDADWLFCRDGKWRPVEPGTFPLAHGAAARVGRLRGYGNAINAIAAQVFIEAYLDTRVADRAA